MYTVLHAEFKSSGVTKTDSNQGSQKKTMCHIQNVHDDEASLVSRVKNLVSELKIVVQLACEPIQMESEGQYTQKKK